MRKFLAFLIGFSLFFPQITCANGAGLPQFFRVNGKFPTTNPLQMYGITAQSFVIPQDIVEEKYVVNEPIAFTIDTEPLRTIIPDELLKNTTYTWDFGDGIKGEGKENTHTYTKMGSYILILTINIYSKDSQTPTQFIDSFLLTIVPYKEYTDLPTAVVTLNGKPANIDPRYNLIHVNVATPLLFDATSSKSPGATINAYFWNFGDGQTSAQAKTTHTFVNKDFYAVVLRVKDSNGFIADAFVGLKNKNSMSQGEKRMPMQLIDKALLFFTFIGIGIILLLLVRTLYKSTSKH
jgi:PKD repeat protein